MTKISLEQFDALIGVIERIVEEKMDDGSSSDAGTISYLRKRDAIVKLENLLVENKDENVHD